MHPSFARKSIRTVVRLAIPAFVFSLAIPTGTAQFTPSQAGTGKMPSMQSPDGAPVQAAPADSERLRQQTMLERSLNDDRHKRLVADTDRLVQLTTELKGEVEHSTRNELSVEVVRKAAEIERLARDVKERMKS